MNTTSVSHIRGTHRSVALNSANTACTKLQATISSQDTDACFHAFCMISCVVGEARTASWLRTASGFRIVSSITFAMRSRSICKARTGLSRMAKVLPCHSYRLEKVLLDPIFMILKCEFFTHFGSCFLKLHDVSTSQLEALVT